MCYMPNLRHRTCRFGPIVAERKLVRKCVFCGRYRPHNVTYFNKLAKPPCPALNTAGHIIVEPNQELQHIFDYHGIIVGKDYHGRVAEIWVPENPSSSTPPTAPHTPG